MDCEVVRAALSARLDGEASGVDDDVVDAHLSECADCRAWFDQAVRLNRSLLIGPAGDKDPLPSVPSDPEPTPEPDFTALSEKILSTVEPERRRRETSWRLVAGAARALLIILGLLYVGWGIALLGDVGAYLPEGAAVTESDPVVSLALDAAAFRFAMAVGMFWAAWRPHAAMGMAPVYGAAAMFSFGFAARDIILGHFGFLDFAQILLLMVSAIALVVVWLGGFTPSAIAQAWRAASGRPMVG